MKMKPYIGEWAEKLAVIVLGLLGQWILTTKRCAFSTSKVGD
jgi:hypothetical protein